MIKNNQDAKNTFSKYKLNLLEKYIASKTILKRSRASQINLMQRKIFTEAVPHQDYPLIKYKLKTQQKSSEARSHTKKPSEKNTVSIFFKEDLIKLGKINENFRNEQKVTKISMLLKKLVNQQVHTDHLENQNQKENLHFNTQPPLRKNLKNFRSDQINNLFRFNYNINLKLFEEKMNHQKNQNQQEKSVNQNTTSRKNHNRYASSISKLKLKYKSIENNCLDTLKICKCEMKQINTENSQKNIKKFTESKRNSPRDEKSMNLKEKYFIIGIRQQNLKKIPIVATHTKVQSHKITIEPWTNHQIILNDPMDMTG